MTKRLISKSVLSDRGETVKVSFTLWKQQKEELERYARSTDRSMSSIIRLLIDDFLPMGEEEKGEEN